MSAPSLDAPLVPASYAARLVAMLAPRGITAAQLLASTGLTEAQLADPAVRMSLAALDQLFANAYALTGDPTIGFALGIGLKASSHGMLGLALLTCNSIGDAVRLGERFMELRGSPCRVQLIVEGERAIMRFVEMVALPMRTMLLEAVLGTTIRVGEFLLGESFVQPAVEFWWDAPEPPHHARFAGQVPVVRYEQPAVQALFPAEWLSRPLALREQIANQEAVSALEHERRYFVAPGAPGDDLVARTRALLANPDERFPGLEQIASRLAVSSRTLRRHLAQHGTVFNALRDEARRARAVMLLEQSQLTVHDIARELAFSDAPSFVRAFQRWTGATPSELRKRARR